MQRLVAIGLFDVLDEILAARRHGPVDALDSTQSRVAIMLRGNDNPQSHQVVHSGQRLRRQGFAILLQLRVNAVQILRTAADVFIFKAVIVQRALN